MFSPGTLQVVVAKRQDDCPQCSNPFPKTSGTESSTSATTILVNVSVTSPTSAESSTSSSASAPGTTSAPSSTPSQSPVVDATSTTSNAGTIAGCVVGGVLFLALVVLALLLYLRARKRKRIAPSSEFMNSFGIGTTPVLRLDSGAEFTPAIPEKGGGYSHYPPPAVPLPFVQNSYSNMKLPDEMMLTDIPSRRPSVDKPLHPQRLSTQATNESFAGQHRHGSSVGSRRELWASNTGDLSPTRLSPSRTDSVLHFAPCLSLDEVPSLSPPSLHPLRRRPD